MLFLVKKCTILLKSCHQYKLLEAGCDEAGRGPLAGPVFAAAVILDRDFNHPLLNDSKQLDQQTLLELRPVIEAKALAWCVAQCSAVEIDRMNILKAAITAMHRALDGLKIAPELILVDGNRFKPYSRKVEAGGDNLFECSQSIPHLCVVKGDATYASIAAASVLAKTYRDDYMRNMARKYPQYGWEHNFGYPTKEHLEAIRKFGICPLHRKTFRGCREIDFK